MTDAERAISEAAADIPAELSARFETTARSDADGRKTIIDIARRALARLYPKPGVKSTRRLRRQALPEKP